MAEAKNDPRYATGLELFPSYGNFFVIFILLPFANATLVTPMQKGVADSEGWEHSMAGDCNTGDYDGYRFFCRRVVRCLAFVICLFIVGICTIPKVAFAQQEAQIALFSIRVSGDAQPSLGGIVERGITSTLQKNGVRVVTLQEIRNATRANPVLSGCTSTQCLEALRDKLYVSRFLAIEVHSRGENYNLLFRVHSLGKRGQKGGPKERTLQGDCNSCNDESFRNMVAHVAVSIAEEIMGDAQTIKISSNPKGGLVTIDRRKVGTTPLKIALFPGTYQMTVQAKDYIPTTQSLQVVATKRPQSVNIELIREHPLPSKKSQKLAHKKTDGTKRGILPVAKWGTAVLSAGAIGSGLYLLSIDGMGTCDTVGSTCPDEYNTATVGWAVIGGGVALAATSALLFVKDGKKKRRRQGVSVVPRNNGLVMSIAGRF